jgi:hypothetical protein
MSLYHQLETVEIPSIGAFRMSPMEESEDFIRSSASFAPPSSQHLMPQQQKNTDPFEDSFITKREQSTQVQDSIPVSSISNRVFGNGGDKKEQKRVVLPEPPEDKGDEVSRFTYGGVVYKEPYPRK